MKEEFAPATSKLEAVVRISALTGSGPENLGPGSKEHKSVFINLSKALNLNLPACLTKQELAKELATTLGGTWNPNCESAGQTITLVGLNLLLEHATARFNVDHNFRANIEQLTVQQEIREITKVILKIIPAELNGVTCIQEMAADGSNKVNMTEWQGYYFEHKCIPKLVSSLGGGPFRVLNTDFDYKRDYVWDLKVHSERSRDGSSNHVAPLNDSAAITQVVVEQGLGFIILSGTPTYSAEFTNWHKYIHRQDPSSWSRVLKSKMDLTKLEVFYFESLFEFDIARKLGIITGFSQGRQTSGHSRNPKFNLNLDRARGSNYQIFEYEY